MNARKLPDYKLTGTERTVPTEGLQVYLQMGRKSAVAVSRAAGAEVRVGKTLRHDLRKIDAYLDTLA